MSQVHVIRQYARSICVSTAVVVSDFPAAWWYDSSQDSEATVPLVAVQPQQVELTEAERAVFRKRPDRVELWRPDGIIQCRKVESVASTRGNKATITTTYRLSGPFAHKESPEPAVAGY